MLLRRLLNAELERKYGANLSGSQGAASSSSHASLSHSKMSSRKLTSQSMPPMSAVDDVNDIDQKLQGTGSIICLAFGLELVAPALF
jgi:hypothetical protein